MIFLFLLLHPIILRIVVLAKKKAIIRVSTTSYNKLNSIGLFTIFISISYILLSYVAKISLKGLYIDYIIGVVIFAFNDILYFIFIQESEISRLYRTARKVYVIYNIVRVFLYFITLLLFYEPISTTFPQENINRTEDISVFDDFYINSTEYTQFSQSGHVYICCTKIKKNFCGIFTREIFKSGDCLIRGHGLPEIKYIGVDSAIIVPAGIFLIQDTNNLFFAKTKIPID